MVNGADLASNFRQESSVGILGDDAIISGLVSRQNGHRGSTLDRILLGIRHRVAVVDGLHITPLQRSQTAILGSTHSRPIHLGAELLTELIEDTRLLGSLIFIGCPVLIDGVQESLRVVVTLHFPVGFSSSLFVLQHLVEFVEATGETIAGKLQHGGGTPKIGSLHITPSDRRSHYAISVMF